MKIRNLAKHLTPARRTWQLRYSVLRTHFSTGQDQEEVRYPALDVSVPVVVSKRDNRGLRVHHRGDRLLLSPILHWIKSWRLKRPLWPYFKKHLDLFQGYQISPAALNNTGSEKLLLASIHKFKCETIMMKLNCQSLTEKTISWITKLPFLLF